MKQKKFLISFNSPIILGFTFLCFIALILNYITHGITNRMFFSIYRSSPWNPLFYIRLFGHVFGHAGWDHFFGNITLILVTGPLLEEKYGSVNLSLVILITALITGIFNLVFFPGTQLLGASGVVFACILLSSMTSITEGSIPVTFILVAVIYIGGQIFDGIFTRDNVSHLTHIMGGGVGAIMGYVLNRKKQNRYCR